MSPAYAAPEQWKGQKPTMKTDIYQFGCTLHQLFAKKLPFDHNSPPALMNAHLNDAPPDLRAANSLVSEALAKAVATALAKTPTDRDSLWKIHDVLAADIIHKYRLTVDLSGETDATRQLVNELTEFNSAHIKKKFIYTYQEYDEALSESIALVANGITKLSIGKVA